MHAIKKYFCKWKLINTLSEIFQNDQYPKTVFGPLQFDFENDKNLCYKKKCDTHDTF